MTSEDGPDRRRHARCTVSVVIPCHNQGRYLEDALASIDRQTRQADEVVVVDDGSTDSTAAVIVRAKMRDPALVAISRSPARGAPSTFNDGVRTCHGDLVVILCADDRLSPTYLERLASALEDDPKHDFAYCEARLFGAETGVSRAPTFDARALVQDNFVNISAMFRRELFDRIGGFRTDLPAWEDWEFWIRAVEHGAHGMPVSGAWLEYRRHEGGSRNTMSHADGIRRHIQIRRLHPLLVRRRDIARRVADGLARRVRRPARL